MFVANEVATAANLNSLLPPMASQAGIARVTPVANVATMIDIKFPTPFVSAPRIFASAQTSVPGSEVKQVWISNETTTGFRAWVLRTNTTKTTIAWQAYGATPSAFVTGQPAYASLLGAVSAAAMVPQKGTVTITPVANTPTSQVITFPVAFSSTPTVVVTEGAGVDGAEVQEVSMSGISTTGFTFYIYRTTATLTYFSWVGVA